MKRLLIFSILLSMLISLSTFKAFQCRSSRDISAELFPPIDPHFAEYISAFTAGVVSSNTQVKIVMASDVGIPVELNTPVENQYFDFEPSLSGKMVWTDARTITFKPDAPMPSDQLYKVNFKLHKLLPVKDDLKDFHFAFKTIKQAMSVEVDNVCGYSISKQDKVQITGTVTTADAIDGQVLEGFFKAGSGRDVLTLTWVHSTDQLTHTFTLDSLHRGDAESKVQLQWNAADIDLEKNGLIDIDIPSINTFKVTKVKVVNTGEQYVSILFSDLLAESLIPNGLAEISELENLRYYASRNEIRLYPTVAVTGSYTLNIVADLANAAGKKLGSPYSSSVKFSDNKPSVKLIGRGTILPDGKGLTLPFEAINLKAVDVNVIKVFENNVTQFLQKNALDGTEELARVGKVIRKKTILLDNSTTVASQWKRYGLNLSDLVKTEPGAIYRVTLSFRQEYVNCNCPGQANKPLELETLEKEQEESQGPTEWGYYYDYKTYYTPDYGDGYDWNQRENPCNKAYYMENRSAARNVLASNLGIIAKRGNDNTFMTIVSDLNTAKPASGVTIDIYDFQRQLIATTSSNSEGISLSTLTAKPFILVAKRGKERGYLKVDDWSNQQMGMFDIGGETVEKGIKAFIYGERGVWRPGDSLFLSLILQDKLHNLPNNFPVTMELFTPQGQLFKRVIKANPLNGFYNFTTHTDKGSPTGNWTANFKVGTSTFSKTLKIETIMPNRLKINIDPGVETFYAETAKPKVNLSSNWLIGSPARNLKADVKMSFSKIPTEFKNFKTYYFENPAATSTVDELSVFEGKLDENGKTSFDIDFSKLIMPQAMMRAYFKTRVFEEGGNFSVDKFSVNLSPCTHYAGFIRPGDPMQPAPLVTGKEQVIQAISVNEKGQPAAGRKLTLRLKKLEWRWWWDREDNDSDYNSYDYADEKQTLEATTGFDGKCTFNFKVENDDWGRYVIEVVEEGSSHKASAEVWFDWADWWTRSTDGGKAPSTLNFSSLKDHYAPGEDIKLSVPGTANSMALVSLETGARVMKAFWVNINKGQNEISFKASPEMAPNIYVHISLVQPFRQTVNDLPIRQYGVIPIRVEDPATHLQPTLAMAEVIRPETTTSIKVSEATGKAMTYTLAIVDEGLLDLTRFKTPDPWTSFYAREALGVRTWDLYDQVIGAWVGEIETVLGIGGDEGLNGKDGAKANRFKPMVKFIGPFYLPAGQSKTHNVAIPAYVGSVRTMLIAGQDGAYGFAEKTSAVRKPLMVLATLPRVLGPDETVKLPVTVFAMEKNIRNVTLTVKAGNMLSPISTTTQNLTFNEIGDQVATFELKVKNVVGVTKISVEAVSGNQSAKDEIEIEIRNPNMPITQTTEYILEPGKEMLAPYGLFGTSGTNKATIEVSAIQSFNLEKRLQYLIQYPHGCVEQTTSSGFPQLYLSDLLDLSKEKQKEVETNIRASMDRLKTFQTTDGGMAYWPGNHDADHWGTNYSGHFMLEAEAKGYSLPVGWKAKWLDFQKKTAQSWQVNKYDRYYWDDDVIQAYRLFTLALAKQPLQGAMNRLREKANLSLAARWRLAAAYSLAGQKEVATKLIYGQPTKVKPYREMDYTYGSNERDAAMILETLTLMGERSKAAGLLKEISDMLCRNEYYSTQTTAYCLMAVSKYVGKDRSKGIDASVTINGKPNEVKLPGAFWQQSIAVNKALNGKVVLKNKGKSPLFARLSVTGRPSFSQTKDDASSMAMRVEYKDLKGKPIDVTSLEQGTDFMAEVTIANPGAQTDIKQLALSQVFASGWEIRNARMDDNPNLAEGKQSSAATYQDIRDDRVYTYFNLSRNETVTYRIQLNAAYLGRYFLAGPNCEAMYDNRFYARKAGKWVEVKAAGKVG